MYNNKKGRTAANDATPRTTVAAADTTCTDQLLELMEQLRKAGAQPPAMCFVADSENFGLAAKVLPNKEAQDQLQLAMSIKSPFIVLAGDLWEPDSGILTAHIRRLDVDSLGNALSVVYRRLTESRVRHSVWAVSLSDSELRATVLASLAQMSAVEGSA